jgi:hypothetical protein
MTLTEQLEKALNDYFQIRYFLPCRVVLPKTDYDRLCEEFKPIMRMPPYEETYDMEKGHWRMETVEEYTERINRKPLVIAYHHQHGPVDIVAGDVKFMMLEA